MLTAQEHFEKAIADGRLSANLASELFAGRYMFMGVGKDGVSLFKNINTREYLGHKQSFK